MAGRLDKFMNFLKLTDEDDYDEDEFYDDYDDSYDDKELKREEKRIQREQKREVHSHQWHKKAVQKA